MGTDTQRKADDLRRIGFAGAANFVERLDGKRMLTPFAIMAKRVRPVRCTHCGDAHHESERCPAPTTRMDGPDMVPGATAGLADRRAGL